MATYDQVHPNVNSETQRRRPENFAHWDVYPLHERMTRRQIPGRHSQIPTSVASFPSQQVGTYEEDFMHKPPYEWKSEGDLFKVKNYS